MKIILAQAQSAILDWIITDALQSGYEIQVANENGMTADYSSDYAQISKGCSGGNHTFLKFRSPGDDGSPESLGVLIFNHRATSVKGFIQTVSGVGAYGLLMRARSLVRKFAKEVEKSGIPIASQPRAPKKPRYTQERHKNMTPEELKEARAELGLTQAQMAALLDTHTVSYAKCETNPEAANYRPLPPRAERLIAAYLSGYRPADWPA